MRRSKDQGFAVPPVYPNTDACIHYMCTAHMIIALTCSFRRSNLRFGFTERGQNACNVRIAPSLPSSGVPEMSLHCRTTKCRSSMEGLDSASKPSRLCPGIDQNGSVIRDSNSYWRQARLGPGWARAPRPQGFKMTKTVLYACKICMGE